MVRYSGVTGGVRWEVRWDVYSWVLCWGWYVVRWEWCQVVAVMQEMLDWGHWSLWRMRGWGQWPVCRLPRPVAIHCHPQSPPICPTTRTLHQPGPSNMVSSVDRPTYVWQREIIFCIQKFNHVMLWWTWMEVTMLNFLNVFFYIHSLIHAKIILNLGMRWAEIYCMDSCW